MSNFETGPTAHPQTEIAALRRRLEAIENQIAQLQQNRAPNPSPVALHTLSNADPMSQAQDGHAVVFNQQTGLYEPRVNLATLIFSMTGTLVTKVSDPLHCRYNGFITGVSADLTTFGSSVEFQVMFNGGALVVVTMASVSTGFIPISPVQPIRGYVDLVTVAVSAVDGTSAGLVVHVEMQ